MMSEGKTVSISKLCGWFGVPRSSFYHRPVGRKRKRVPLDPRLVEAVRSAIKADPDFGVRRLTVMAARGLNRPVNRKAVHRVVKANGWQVIVRAKGHRPRVKGWVSRSTRPNERWAIDASTVFCGSNGWCHLIAIIDCYDRVIVGWRLTKRAVAKTAAATLEDALRSRGIVPSGRPHLTLRSDNGLVFGAKDFVSVANRHGLTQEYITPYSPEQNGMIERWFRSIKEECVWHHRFRSQDEAFLILAQWIDRYHTVRPHSALGYKTPAEFMRDLAA
jgi:putative transposase